MTVIPLATEKEREFQKARIAYMQDGGLCNFMKFRKAYEALEGELCFTTKK